MCVFLEGLLTAPKKVGFIEIGMLVLKERYHTHLLKYVKSI